MSQSNSIRTTHIGSLPRPQAVRDLLGDPNARGTEEFESTVRDAVLDVVRRQAEVGLDVANDGEQGRATFHVDVTNRLTGYGGRLAEPERWADLEDVPEYAEQAFGDAEDAGRPVAEGPVEYVGEDELRRELDRFDEAVRVEEASFAGRFLTAPSPGIVATGTESEYHDSHDAYVFAIAEALRTEYELVADSGATLQVDAPDLLADYHRAFTGASSEAFRERVRTHVDALNRALDGVPADQVRLHACWGNYPGPHHHDVPLDEVIDEIYEADVGGLVVEGANPRHQHEYATLAEHPLPDGWTLVPGVIDVKSNIVEHPDVVAERIERFADAVGDPSRVVAGADCGFATLAGLNTVHPDVVWKKLEALVDGAALASERLT